MTPKNARMPRTTASRAARLEYAQTVKSIATQKEPPLFKQRPPRWVRWIWLTAAADLIFFTNSMYMTWYNWSEQVDTPPKAPTPSGSEIKVNDNDAEPAPKWQLRPVWQRAGLCAAFFASGVGIAGGLLYARSRVIRTLTLTPRTAELSSQPKNTRQQLLYMRNCEQPEEGGFLLPLNICTLREGRQPSELVLAIEGRKGAWNLQLDGAMINGKPSSVLEARRAFINEWKDGKLGGLWTPDVKLEKKWKSGLVAGGAV